MSEHLILQLDSHKSIYFDLEGKTAQELARELEEAFGYGAIGEIVDIEVKALV